MITGGPVGAGGGGGGSGPMVNVAWKTVILVQALSNTSGPIFKL